MPNLMQFGTSTSGRFGSSETRDKKTKTIFFFRSCQKRSELSGLRVRADPKARPLTWTTRPLIAPARSKERTQREETAEQVLLQCSESCRQIIRLRTVMDGGSRPDPQEGQDLAPAEVEDVVADFVAEAATSESEAVTAMEACFKAFDRDEYDQCFWHWAALYS